MTEKIWLLVGERGEYSDHSMWNVRAYTTKEAAESARDKITSLAQEATMANGLIDGGLATMANGLIDGGLVREIEVIDKSVVHRDQTGAARWAYPYEQPTWRVQEIPLVSGT